MSTEDLLALVAEIKADIAASPDGEPCDNFAPGTCCEYCNRWLIIDELARREVHVTLDG